MKVSYRTVKINNNHTKDLKGYEKVSTDFCCAEMISVLDDEFFVYGGYGLDHLGKHNIRSENQICIVKQESGYYGDIDETNFEIHFCPFCGERIIYEEVERISLTQQKTEETVTLTQTKVEWIEEKC